MVWKATGWGIEVSLTHKRMKNKERFKGYEVSSEMEGEVNLYVNLRVNLRARIQSNK